MKLMTKLHDILPCDNCGLEQEVTILIQWSDTLNVTHELRYCSQECQDKCMNRIHKSTR